ncbi:FAD-binding oxidoreductase [Palleronia sp. LCG004]|uniref:NAD(P)/FAD-dependent oxidoreductase n=1 Tax=Palleronia sp. LCG004 TaxID=3079304 RepID=UPI0029428E2A|nr:FAD-binding oxidoreductase [Palleronia sp. LCG004]WOI58237.1 FAD-binding oxidoreductase [Palleronia sp. LCG004]
MSDTSNASDVVIVGGGIYGTSLAYRMARAGRSVTLLEKGEIASGASGGPGERGVRANRRDLRELPVIAEAMKLWAEAEAELEGGVGYRRLGSLQVFDVPYGHHHHEVMGKMQTMAEVQTALGTPSEILDRDAMLAREPLLNERLLGALYCPDDGVGNHTFATQQFAKAAEAAGAVIRTGAEAVEIATRGGEARGVVLATGETVPVGGQLVVLANPGVKALLSPHDPLVANAPIWHLMPQMMYVTNPHGKSLRHLLSHAHRRLAVKQIVDGTMMLSGGASVSYTEEGAWRGSLSSTALNLTDAIQTLPFLDDSSFISVDASRVEAVTLDGIPIVGQPQGMANAYYGYGWSGHGFAISLGFSKLFEEWMTGGEKPAMLDPFTPDRFMAMPAAGTKVAERTAAYA